MCRDRTRASIRDMRIRATLTGRVALVVGADPVSLASAQALERQGALLRRVDGEGEVEDEVLELLERFGRLDIAVNSPGPPGRNGTLAVPDCRAVYVAMRHELPAMARSGGGAIVNAAIARGERHEQESQCVVGLSRAAALDNTGTGVRVNSVSGGSGTAEDFAAAAVWLCSDAAAQVTGASVPLGLRPAPAQPTQPGLTSPYS
jgi:hypothetical protein